MSEVVTRPRQMLVHFSSYENLKLLKTDKPLVRNLIFLLNYSAMEYEIDSACYYYSKKMKNP